MIVDGILKNALKQHRQLAKRLPGVLLRQFEHRFLDNVERRVFVANCEHRLLERPALDFCEKCRKFLVRGQFESLQLEWSDYKQLARGILRNAQAMFSVAQQSLDQSAASG